MKVALTTLMLVASWVPSAWGQTTPGVGDVVISELAARSPSDGSGDWVELYAAGEGTWNLRGCALVDTDREGSDQDRLSFDDDLILEAGAYHLMGGPFPEGCATPIPSPLSGIDLVKSYRSVLRLECPDGGGGAVVVDEMSFNWGGDDLDGDDTLQRDPSDPLRVCVAPAEAALCADLGVAGTPGSPNPSCPPPPNWPGAGELVITEIMVSPLAGSEWFEVFNAGSDAIDLDGCVASEEGPLPECRDTDPATCTAHDTSLENGDGLLHIEAGGYLVLAKSNCDSFEVGVPCVSYSSLSFNDGDMEELWITCPVEEGTAEQVEVDRISYHHRGAGAAKGESLSLAPGLESPDGGLNNDDPSGWCTIEGGTPAQPNAQCPPPPVYPSAGQLLITEVMVSPSVGPEWFELHNPFEGQSFDVAGCLVAEEGPLPDCREGVGEEGEGEGESEREAEPVAPPDEEQPKPCTRHDYVLKAEDGGALRIGPGGYLLLAKSSCELFVDSACASYSSLSFNDGDVEDLWLTCPAAPGAEPSVEVDRITFDKKGHRLNKGESFSFNGELPESPDPTVNDDPTQWCSHLEGSPGFVNECGRPIGAAGGGRRGTVVPPPTGCGCALPGGSSGPGSALWWTALLALWMARRR